MRNNLSHSQVQSDFMRVVREAIKKSPLDRTLNNKVTGVQYPYKELCQKEYKIDPNSRFADVAIRTGDILESTNEVKLYNENIILVECKATLSDLPKAFDQLRTYETWIEDHNGGRGRAVLLLSESLVKDNPVAFTRIFFHDEPAFDVIFRDPTGHKYHWFVHDKEQLPHPIEMAKSIETEWGRGFLK